MQVKNLTHYIVTLVSNVNKVLLKHSHAGQMQLHLFLGNKVLSRSHLVTHRILLLCGGQLQNSRGAEAQPWA